MDPADHWFLMTSHTVADYPFEVSVRQNWLMSWSAIHSNCYYIWVELLLVKRLECCCCSSVSWYFLFVCNPLSPYIVADLIWCLINLTFVIDFFFPPFSFHQVCQLRDECLFLLKYYLLLCWYLYSGMWGGRS